MGRFFARSLPMLLCLACLAGPVAALAQTPRFTGTFVQISADKADWDLARWTALFASLRAVGIDEIVVQWSVDGEVPLYASTQFPAAPRNVLPAVLEAAGGQGLRVVLGLVHDPAYWARIEREPKLVRVYFRRLCAHSLAVAGELAALVRGNPAFAGFYIPQEIDDRNWLDPARNTVLTEYLGDLTTGLHAVAPDVPVAISGFSNAFADPDLLRQFWESLLGTTGIDRVLFQDGIGVAKLHHGEAGLFLAAVSRAAQAKGRVYTPVVETFTQVDGPPQNDKPFRAVPAPLDRLQRQLRVAGAAPHTGIVAFSLPEYCSPFGGPEAAALYAAYKQAFR